MKRGTESIVRLGKSVEPADFSGINVLSTVILGKKESATKDFNGLFITDAVLLGKKISHSAVVTATVHGVSPLSLPDAIANSLSYVKAFGGAEQRNLPNGYTQVDYVTNTIKTAVNTGIMIDLTKNYEFEVECRATTGPWFILQSRESISLPNTGITGSGTGDTIILIVDGTAVCTSGNTRALGNRLYINATLNNGVGTLYVKDITAGTEDTVTGNYSTSATNPTVPMYLLGNAAGQYVDTDSNVYMARIKENGVTIMDYVPAKQDTTAGFYDTVRGTFKTAGTPSGLSAGAVVSPSPDTPVDIVSNNGVLKVSRQLLTNGNCANNTDNWVLGFVSYNNTDDYITFTNNTSNYTYIRCNTNGSRIANHTYAYLITGKTETGTISWGSRNAGPAGTSFQPTEQTLGFIDTFPEGGSGEPWINIPAGATFMLNKKSGFRMFDLTALGLDTVITTPEQAINYFGTTYREPKEVYADGTVETINAHGKNLAIVSQSSAGLGYVKIPSSLLNKTVTLSNNSTDFLQYAIGDTPYQSIWIAVTLITTFTVTQEMIDTVGLWVRKSSTYGAMTAAELNSINLQLELGSTATEYEPYFNGGTATAEMLLKVGDYQDVQSILDGVITRNVGVKVFDGTETFTFPDRKVFRYILDDFPAGVKLMSNYFKGDVNPAISIAAMPDMTIKGHGTVSKNVYFKYTEKGTITEFQQWLADQYANGTPVIVIYPLAEPTTETVTGQTLQVQSGDNVLEITQASLDGLELEAQYQKRE